MATITDPNTVHSVENAKKKLYWQLFSLHLLRHALLSMAVYLFVYGLLILIFRFCRLESAVSVLSYGWIVGILLLIISVWMAFRKSKPIQERFGELIDSKAQLGGQLMYSEAIGADASQLKISADSLPHVQYRAKWHVSYLVMSVLFFLGATLFPIENAFGPDKQIDLSTHVDKYQKQIEALEEEKVITPELADQLEEQLLQISQKASSLEPAETWQALEELKDRIQEEASVATQDMVKEGQKLAEIEMKASENSQKSSSLDDLQKLNDLIDKQREQNSHFKDAVENDKELAKLLEQIEKKIDEMLDAQQTKAKLILNKDLTEEQKKKIEQALSELGLDSKENQKSVDELDAEQMKKLEELAKEFKNDSLEEQLKKIEKELADSGLSEKNLELSNKQLKDLKEKLAGMGLDADSHKILEEPGASPVNAKVQKVISQIFINSEIVPDDLKKASKIVEDLKVPKKQFGKIEVVILEGLKERLADGKLTDQELDYLRPEIDAHLYNAGELKPVDNEVVDKIEQKWKDLGIPEEDYLILRSSECQCQGGGAGMPSDEDLIGLAQKAQQLRQQMMEKLKRLQESGALNQRLGQQGMNALGSYGQGGINRGGSPIPMSFNKDASDSKDKKFKPLLLPLSRINEEKSKLLAVQKGNAKDLKAGKIDETRVLSDKKSVGETNKTRILPEHRIYLEKYRKSEKE